MLCPPAGRRRASSYAPHFMGALPACTQAGGCAPKELPPAAALVALCPCMRMAMHPLNPHAWRCRLQPQPRPCAAWRYMRWPGPCAAALPM